MDIFNKNGLSYSLRVLFTPGVVGVVFGLFASTVDRSVLVMGIIYALVRF